MDYSELFDKIFKEAEAIGRTVLDTTKDTADKAKNKLDLKRAEYERDKAYTALGRIMYQVEKGLLNRDESIIAAACKRVEDQEEEIRKLKEAMEEKEEAPAAEETEVEVEVVVDDAVAAAEAAAEVAEEVAEEAAKEVEDAIAEAEAEAEAEVKTDEADGE